jgi:ECF sigma factor
MSTSEDRVAAQALHDLAEGRQSSEAVEELYDHVIARLVQWARMMLGKVPRGAADEDDVALNAFEKFCASATAGRFPQVERIEQVWPILYTLTLQTTSRLRHYVYAQKRDPRRVIEINVDALEDRKPSGEQVTDSIDQKECLISVLRDDGLRRIASMVYEGWTNPEIATRMHQSIETVQRKRTLIRRAWERRLSASRN